jgi:hypothetical protein
MENLWLSKVQKADIDALHKSHDHAYRDGSNIVTQLQQLASTGIGREAMLGTNHTGPTAIPLHRVLSPASLPLAAQSDQLLF